MRVVTPGNEEYLLMLAEHGTAARIERIAHDVRHVHAEQELLIPVYTAEIMRDFRWDA